MKSNKEPRADARGSFISPFPAIVGAACGLLLGFLGIRQMSGLALFGATSAFPWIAAGILALVTTVVGVATVVPALGAVALEPNAALRYE